jgi:hypothetical protein
MLRTALYLLLCGLTFAQQPQPKIVVKLDAIPTVTAKVGIPVNVAIAGRIDTGFHVNADKQNDEYLIPIRLTWVPGVLDSGSVVYPKYETVKLAFSDTPVNIYSGEFKIETRFKVAKKSALGPATVTGKLRYQACNDRECLIPRTLDVSIPVEIVK